MKRLISILFVITIVVFNLVFAEERFVEHFDYSAGDLITNAAWTGLNTGDEIQVVSNSLTYTGITSSGNKVQFEGVGRDASRSVGTEVTSGTLYASFLVQVSAMSSFTSDGYFAGFLKGASTYGSTVWFIKDGEKIKIGLYKRSGDDPDQTFATTYDVGTTLFIVVCYDFTGTPEARLWINPTLGLESEPSSDLTSTTGNNMSGIESFFFRQDSSTKTPQIQLDELRVTTTWAEATLPVTLSTFTAQYLNSKPTLYWQTQSEEDNMGWFIYRNTVEDFTSSEKISEMIPGHGTTTQPQDYIYEDAEQLQVEQTYYYWLESVDYSGTIHHFDRVAQVTIPPDDPGQNVTPPVAYEITADPNPFSYTTNITFAMNQTSLVDLAIYNVRGQLVKSFGTVMTNVDEEVSFQWNGKDNAGKSLSNGVYLYVVKVNGKDYATRQLILMK